MNKGKTILLHAAGWLIILCSPFMYIDHWSSFSFTRYLFYSMTPLMLMVVFYLNYLFLVPRYYIRGNRLLFFAVNVVATIAPLIIISLVENAFKHGVSPTLPSFIDININVHDNTIDCLIRNSNFPKPAGDKSGHGIGLQQVARRLELSYPGRYQWNQFVRDDIFHSHIIITQLL